MFRKFMSIIVVVAFIVSSSGCAKYNKNILPNYDAKSLPEKLVVKDNVSVGTVFLDENEVQRFFDADTQGRGVQPVYVLIENNSGTSYVFKKELISPEFILAEDAAKKCARRTMAKQVISLPLLILIPIGISVMIANGILGSIANDRMETDYISKEISDGVVTPGSSLKGVVFMPIFEDQKILSIPLVSRDTREEITFSFECPIQLSKEKE